MEKGKDKKQREEIKEERRIDIEREREREILGWGWWGERVKGKEHREKLTESAL